MVGTWGDHGEVGGIDLDDTSDDEDDGGGPEVLDVGSGLDDSAGGGDGGEGGECPCENVLDGIYVLDATPPASVWFYDPAHDMLSEIGDVNSRFR